MKRLVIAGVLSLVTVAGASDALAQKSPKCVYPSMSVTVADTTGLGSDGRGVYTDAVVGVYAKMDTCGGTLDTVLALNDVTQRQMFLTLSDGMYTATRLDVTGVGSVTNGCVDTKTATIWFTNGAGSSSFLRFSAVHVCESAGSWTVQPLSGAARFDSVKGKYRLVADGLIVPFAVSMKLN